MYVLDNFLFKKENNRMKYLHPHVSDRVIDNSFVAIIAEGSTALLAPTFSDKGRDGHIEDISGRENYLAKYGEPNITKYGQSAYNILNWLGAGGRAYVCRLLPDDARFANVTLKVKVTMNGDKASESIFLAESADTGVSKEAAVKTTVLAEPTVDGDKHTFILGTFLPVGRGAAYNDLSIRIDLADDLLNTYDYRVYRLSVFERNRNDGSYTQIEGPFTVTFQPGSRDLSRNSMYFADVINKYAQTVRVIDNPRTYDALTEKLLGQEQTDPRLVDIVGGVKINTKKVKKENAELPADLVFKNNITGDANYDAAASGLGQQISLANGFDGDLSFDKQKDLLVKFYSGDINPEVRDTQGIYADVILDANHDIAVKNELSKLARTREDCVAIVDMGIKGGYQDTLKFRQDELTIADRYTSIFCQDGEVYDQYTGSNIRVTPTYILADKIVSTDRTHGIQFPFVGPRRGTISGFTKINFFPTEEEKNTLHSNKINYIERDPRKINFGNQITSQAQNSALSDISHVRVLNKIRRQVREICADYRLELNDGITLENMSYDINNALKVWVANRACTECSASVSSTEYEKLQRRATVTVNVRFTGILERIQVDIVVGK